MRGKRVLVVMAVLAICVGLVGQQIPLLQLSDLPPDRREAVLAAIRPLEEVLADWQLGCGGAAVKLGWNAYQLACFVAGRLDGLGYPARLAHAGEDWWVLVQVGGDQGPFWVPVIPGVARPEDGKRYQLGVFLGHVPWDETGDFLLQYLSPDEVLPLPANRPPQGKIRFSPVIPKVGQEIRFFGSLCVDPDGVIVSMIWDFGDGGTSTYLNPTDTDDREGTYTVTLTLVDDAGAEVKLVKEVRVRELSGSGGGCGCGG